MHVLHQINLKTEKVSLFNITNCKDECNLLREFIVGFIKSIVIRKMKKNRNSHLQIALVDVDKVIDKWL